MRGHDLGMESLPDAGLYGRGDECGRTDQERRRCIGSYDLVLVATDHSWYDWAKVYDSVRHGKAQGVIVDTRNAMRGVPDPTGVVVKA